MAILPMFVLGSFAGSVQLGDWLALGALPAVGLVQRWGAGGALAATLAGLAVVTWLVGRWSGQPFDPRRIPRRWLGALALALLATLNLFIAGQPWGIVYGFGLWGAKRPRRWACSTPLPTPSGATPATPSACARPCCWT
jgi:hypothetical protein